MGWLADWTQKSPPMMDGFGQRNQSNLFTNPNFEQQNKPNKLANMLMNPNGMQPNNSMLLNPNTTMQNWNSQYGGY